MKMGTVAKSHMSGVQLVHQPSLLDISQELLPALFFSIPRVGNLGLRQLTFVALQSVGLWVCGQVDMAFPGLAYSVNLSCWPTWQMF